VSFAKESEALPACLSHLSFAKESEALPACPSHLRVSAIEGEPSTAWAASVIQVALDRA
jgi:hypothetical protein